MKKKMGRPKLPDGTAKTNIVALKLSAEELEEIQLNVSKSGMSQPDWMRSKLFGDSGRDGTIVLRFACPDCGNKFKKLPSGLKPGGATVCPKCGRSFVDKAVVEGAEAMIKLLAKTRSGGQ